MRLIAPRFLPLHTRQSASLRTSSATTRSSPARNDALLRLLDTVDELTLAHGGVLLALPQVVLAGISPLRA